MPPELRTPGEILVGRKLAIEQRGSIDHYVTGQHGVEDLGQEDGTRICLLSFVNALGFVKRIPMVRMPEREWEPVGLEHTGTPHQVWGPRRMPEDFKLSEAMLEVLRRLEE